MGHECYRLPNVIVLSTRGSKVIAEHVCQELAKRLPNGMKGPNGIFGEVKVSEFDNANIEVQIPDIRGKFVVIIHTMAPNVGDEFMELIALIDAIRNSSPGDILLVFSYMPFSRSDKKDKPRISVMAKTYAEIINFLGVKKVLLLDPHATHIKHYFSPAADEITSIYLLANYINTIFFHKYDKKNCTLVFPDEGSAKRFHKLAGLLKINIAHINKYRKGNDGEVQISEVIGFVEGRDCLLIDDEILGGGTVGKDAEVLMNNYKAKSVTAIIVHPVLRKKGFSDKDFFNKLMQMPVENFIFTDTLAINRFEKSDRITIISIYNLIAEAIMRITKNESISALYDTEQVEFYK